MSNDISYNNNVEFCKNVNVRNLEVFSTFNSYCTFCAEGIMDLNGCVNISGPLEVSSLATFCNPYPPLYFETLLCGSQGCTVCYNYCSWAPASLVTKSYVDYSLSNFKVDTDDFISKKESSEQKICSFLTIGSSNNISNNGVFITNCSISLFCGNISLDETGLKLKGGVTLNSCGLSLTGDSYTTTISPSKIENKYTSEDTSCSFTLNIDSCGINHNGNFMISNPRTNSWVGSPVCHNVSLSEDEYCNLLKSGCIDSATLYFLY